MQAGVGAGEEDGQDEGVGVGQPGGEEPGRVEVHDWAAAVSIPSPSDTEASEPQLEPTLESEPNPEPAPASPELDEHGQFQGLLEVYFRHWLSATRRRELQRGAL